MRQAHEIILTNPSPRVFDWSLDLSLPHPLLQLIQLLLHLQFLPPSILARIAAKGKRGEKKQDGGNRCDSNYHIAIKLTQKKTSI